MRLGAFVIHGDAAATLPRCLASLRAVGADDLVAVDSGATDGSAELARAAGARVVPHPWRGYGAARAAAVDALRASDWIFFLDSDEYLLEDAVAHLRRWREGSPDAVYYRLVRRDWVELPERRFVYRHERHVRLVRADAARWRASMLVHETLPRGPAVRDLAALVEHRFVDAAGVRGAKEERYALLWALRAHAEGWRRKPPALSRAAHAFRHAVLKGAALRGGGAGVALAWELSRYHARKHALLADLRRGAHPDMVAALREERLGDLYALVDAYAAAETGRRAGPGGRAGARPAPGTPP